jgi:uncharacterized protein (DUF58 family)
MKRDENGVYVTLDELLKFAYSAKGFSFLPSQPVRSILSGRHSSKVRGRGMDFNEMKQYVQGDDTHNIDWKATRRTGKSYIRVYNEERDRNVWLVISQRNSMFFGSKMMMKSVAAAHLAAVSAFRVLESGDRVGAVIYNDEELKFFKASRSKQGLMQIFAELVRQNRLLKSSNIANNGEQLAEALKVISATAKHDDLIILIGDGRALDKNTTHYITLLNTHNDVIAALVYDPMEKMIPPSGSLFLSDGLEVTDVDSSSKNFQEAYVKNIEKRAENLINLSKKNTIPLLKIATDRPVLDQIQEQLGAAVSAKRKA